MLHGLCLSRFCMFSGEIVSISCLALVGLQSIVMSVGEAAEFMMKSVHVTRYWQQKVADPNFHPGFVLLTNHFVEIQYPIGSWGGARTFRHEERERFLLHFSIFCKTLDAPQITALEVTTSLSCSISCGCTQFCLVMHRCWCI